MTIHEATAPAAVLRCHPVMRELRPHLADPAEFATRVARQQQTDGYRLAFTEDAGEVRAVAGYRFQENLVAGRLLYVDDLVTRTADHGRGYGSALFDWLAAQAREAGCATLQLDSGVQRHGAHRFYLGKGMDITSYHFVMRL